MLIRKNTKAFKTILQLVNECQDRPDREKLIRLYITRAGQSLKDRISIEGIQDQAGLFYEMNYQAVLNNLKSSGHQLHQSDEITGIYFFNSTANKEWDETPFEFDEAIKKEFGSLPELPALRKKGRAEKFRFPAPITKKESAPLKKKKIAKPPTAITTVDNGPRQPAFKLKHKIHFTSLDKVIFRQPQVNKQDVLNYYDKIAEYILPYLKDRLLYRPIRVIRQLTETLMLSTAESHHCQQAYNA